MPEDRDISLVTNVRDIKRGLEKLDDKNDEAHKALTDKIETLAVNNAVAKVGLLQHQDECKRKHNSLNRLAIALLVALVAGSIGLIIRMVL
jgi:hypothetical protein